MATKIQVRRGLSTEWTSVNPTLSAGEIGLETNTGNFKIGNGTSAWNSLPYSVATQTYVNAQDAATLASANNYTDIAVSGLGNTIDGNYVPVGDVGQPDGVATLDATGNVPLSQLANLVDGAPLDLDTLKELAEAISNNKSIHSFAMIG